MKTKQYPLKQTVGYRRNQRKKKKPYNISELREYSESCPNREVYEYVPHKNRANPNK